MPEQHSIFYQTILLTAVNLLLRAGSTIFSVYISRRIGAESVGILQLVLSAGMVFTTLATAGVRTATMYLTAEQIGKGQSKQSASVLKSSMLYSLCCSLPVAFAIPWIAPYLSSGLIGVGGVQNAIRIYGLFLPINCLCGCMSGYLTAHKKIMALTCTEILEQVIYILTAFLWLHFTSSLSSVSACTILIFSAGISSCSAFFILLYLVKLSKNTASVKPSILRKLMQTAVPLGAADNLKAGISATENFIVPKRLSLYPGAGNPIAVYGMLSAMVFPVLMFPASILYSLSELLIPELSRCQSAGSHRRKNYLVWRSLRIALIYGCFCGSILYLCSNRLCVRLYNSEKAGQILCFFAPLVPMLYVDIITDAMTKGLGQQKVCVRYNIITSALDVVLLFFLLPRAGIAGYFISFTISHALNFLLSLSRLLKITNVSLNFRAAGRILGLSFLSLLAARCFPPSLAPGIFLMVVTPAFFLSGAIPQDEIAWFCSLLRKK